MRKSRKLITREDLREYLEDNFVDLYELAKEQFVGGGYLEEKEFETTYKESKTLYDTKKPTPKSRRSTILVMCESVTSQVISTPRP